MHQTGRRVSKLGYPRRHPARVHSQYRKLELHLAEPPLCCAAVYPVVTGLALDAMRAGQPCTQSLPYFYLFRLFIPFVWFLGRSDLHVDGFLRAIGLAQKTWNHTRLCFLGL